jgi:hypothetical protein
LAETEDVVTPGRGPRAVRAARVRVRAWPALAVAAAALAALASGTPIARAQDAPAAPDSAAVDSLATTGAGDTAAVAPPDSAVVPAPAPQAAPRSRQVAEPGTGSRRDEARMIFFASTAFPSSRQFNRYWQSGVGLGGGFSFPVWPWLTMTGNLALDHFQFDEAAFVDQLVAEGGSRVDISGLSANVITALGGVRIHLVPHAATSVFLSASGGVAYVGLDDGFANDAPIQTPAIESAPGRGAILLGLGVRRSHPGRFGWLLEAGWMNILEGGDDLRYLPLRIAVLFPEEIPTR